MDTAPGVAAAAAAAGAEGAPGADEEMGDDAATAATAAPSPTGRRRGRLNPATTSSAPASPRTSKRPRRASRHLEPEAPAAAPNPAVPAAVAAAISLGRSGRVRKLTTAAIESVEQRIYRRKRKQPDQETEAAAGSSRGVKITAAPAAAPRARSRRGRGGRAEAEAEAEAAPQTEATAVVAEAAAAAAAAAEAPPVASPRARSRRGRGGRAEAEAEAGAAPQTEAMAAAEPVTEPMAAAEAATGAELVATAAAAAAEAATAMEAATGAELAATAAAAAAEAATAMEAATGAELAATAAATAAEAATALEAATGAELAATAAATAAEAATVPVPNAAAAAAEPTFQPVPLALIPEESQSELMRKLRAQAVKCRDPRVRRLLLDLSHDTVTTACEAAGIMWGRVKGYPFWPCQRMHGTLEVCIRGFFYFLRSCPPVCLPLWLTAPASSGSFLQSFEALGLTLSSRRKETDVPVMYFGTQELSWLGGENLLSWSQGMSRWVGGSRATLAWRFFELAAEGYSHPTIHLTASVLHCRGCLSGPTNRRLIDAVEDLHAFMGFRLEERLVDPEDQEENREETADGLVVPSGGKKGGSKKGPMGPRVEFLSRVSWSRVAGNWWSSLRPALSWALPPPPADLEEEEERRRRRSGKQGKGSKRGAEPRGGTKEEPLALPAVPPRWPAGAPRLPPAPVPFSLPPLYEQMRDGRPPKFDHLRRNQYADKENQPRRQHRRGAGCLPEPFPRCCWLSCLRFYAPASRPPLPFANRLI